MGRGRSGRGSSRGKGKGDAAEKSSRYINRVDLYKFLCKWELRSYPDNHGRPLFESPAHLSTEHLRTILDGDCSELLRRPLMGLNLSSASIDSAALFAPRLTASLAQIQALLEKESLNEAVRYFNLNRDVERDSTASRDMCKVYFKQVQKAMRDHGPLLAEAAEAAAAVYTGLMALLELAAVTEDIRWWASKVPEVKKQAKHIQAWLAHPKDEDKLFHALAHGIKADEKKNLRRERSFGQLDAEAARSSSSVPLSGDGSDSLSTDSTSTMSGKKKKKSRRAQKRSVDHKRKKHGKKEKSRKSRDAGGSKAKRTRRSAKKSSSADSSPSGKDGRKMKKLDHGSDTTSVECATAAPPLQEIWPLAEIQAFESKAQEVAAAADGAELAVQERLGLLKCLPVDVQTLVLQRAGLQSTAGDAVLQANAANVSKHVAEMVREARLAWAQAAIHEDSSKGKSNVVLLPENDIFERMQTASMPEPERTKWSTLRAASEDDVKEARVELLHAVWSKDTVTRNYERALDFGDKYQTREPKKDAVRSFLAMFKEETLQLFALPSLQKFEKRKAPTWTTYCSVAYTLAWMVFKAHCEVDSSPTP